MGDVFDDVEAIEDLNARGVGKVYEAEALMAWGKRALALHARLKEEVRAGAKLLPDAASEARSLLDGQHDRDAPEAPPAAQTPKRGRGPDRQPRKPKGTTNEMKDAPAEPAKPEPIGDAEVLLDALKDGPLTRAGIEAIVGWSQGRIRDVLDGDGRFTTWTMQRDGDSEPVAVWGTTAQRDAYVNSIPIQTRAKVPDAPK